MTNLRINQTQNTAYTKEIGGMVVGGCIVIAGILVILATMKIMPHGVNAISRWGHGLATGNSLIGVGGTFTIAALTILLVKYGRQRKKIGKKTSTVAPKSSAPLKQKDHLEKVKEIPPGQTDIKNSTSKEGAQTKSDEVNKASSTSDKPGQTDTKNSTPGKDIPFNLGGVQDVGNAYVIDGEL